MQQVKAAKKGTETGWKNAEAAVRTQAVPQVRTESLEEVAHDARNMVAALDLYCDLLEEPGVLSESFAHYGQGLRQVASASRRLVEKLTTTGQPATAVSADLWRSENNAAERWPVRMPGGRLNDVQDEGWTTLMPAAPVENLAGELLATRNLLSALAGPAIVVTMNIESGARPTRITSEDLTRILVNLVKNAVEVMPGGGRIQISLHEQAGKDGEWLVLAVEDNGPGIPEDALERIFESGYTGHKRQDAWPVTHRGLGLPITRAIIEAAGGRIHAENRMAGGAQMVMELPAGR